MDEYEKWLTDWRNEATMNGFGYALPLDIALIKYRSMTCKMEYVDALSSFFKCSACGSACNVDMPNPPRFCPDCGCRVVEEKE